MKKYLALSMLIFTYLSTLANSNQSPGKRKLTATSSRDSITLFYGELFKALKTGYLHRNSVNWKKIEKETYQKLSTYNNFKSSLIEITQLFDKIDATHCLIYRDNQRYTAIKEKLPKERYSVEVKKKYDSKPAFEAKVLDRKFAYILIPGMSFNDNSAGYLSKVAQSLYDQVAQLKSNNRIEGWIVDLRMNTGGNSIPMLLALYDLLGDNGIWGELNLNKKMVSKHRLEKGTYYYKAEPLAAIKPKGPLLDRAPVALITGSFTGSSGEVTALAFKGRTNTVFIGENTAGFTTGNIIWPLPFDTTMALTTAYDGDRNGNYYPFISPDIPVAKQDNFDNLLLDGNIKAAINFISQSPAM